VPLVTWIIWILFSIYICNAFFLALKNKPAFIVDNLGIIDNASLFACGRIEWNHIDAIEIRNGVNVKCLCFFLVDDQKVIQKFNPLKQMIVKSNKNKIGTICIIPEISLNENLETGLSTVNSFRPPEQ
jgi:hypothetical protein